MLFAENEEIADGLLRLTHFKKRWEFGLWYSYLRNIKGFKCNHKRVYRIYRELELNLYIQLRRRLKKDKSEALSVPETANQIWPMDCMSDSRMDGRSLRTFNVIERFWVLKSICHCLALLLLGHWIR